jgi:hypothetical protein
MGFIRILEEGMRDPFWADNFRNTDGSKWINVFFFNLRRGDG